MIEVFSATLAASLVGSLHCIGMCGPLVAMHGGARSFRLALVHALGRLATYALFGAVAGLVGSAVDLAGSAANLQRVASVIAAAVIVAWGLHAMYVAVRKPRATEGGEPSEGSDASAAAPPTGGPLGRAFAKGLVQLRRRRRPSTRAWLAGVITGLLPCGWLWAFVIAAAGTGSVLGGVLTMTAFWLGTVPAMTGALTVAAPLIGLLRRKLPIVTASVMMLLGLAMITSRWSKAGIVNGVGGKSCCHESFP